MNVNYIYGSFYIKQNEQHDPDLHINAMTKFKVRPFIFTNYNVKLSLSVVYFWYYGALGLCGSLVIYWYQFSFLEISRNKLNSNYNTRGAFYSWTPWPTSLEMILVSFKFMGSEWRYSDFLWLSSVLWVSSKCMNIEFYSGSSIFSLINRHLERKSWIVTGKRNSIWMNYRVWSR